MSLNNYDYEEWKEVLGIDRRNELTYLFLELTTKCNLFCEHCASNCGKADESELTTEQWKAFLKYIRKHFDSRSITLCVTGGEPMLRSDFYEIMKYAQRQGLKWGMTTNGTLINEDDVLKLVHSGMKTVSISVDGLEEYHDQFRRSKGSFQKAINALKLLGSCWDFETVQATTVVTKDNIDQLPELYELFKSIKLRDWRITNMDPSGRAKNSKKLLDADDFLTLFDFIEKLRRENKIHVQYGCSHYVPQRFKYNLRDTAYNCGAGKFVASVLSNGDIFSCLDIERRPELIQGNILKDDFLTVWENGFKEFQGMTRCSKSPVCSKCDNNVLCQGDSAHTWNYDMNVPKVCLFDMLKSKRLNAFGICGKCGTKLFDDAAYCHHCGTKRGQGKFSIYDYDPRGMQTLYGPPPRKHVFTCKKCGKTWDEFLMDVPKGEACPECGSGIENLDIDKTEIW